MCGYIQLVKSYSSSLDIEFCSNTRTNMKGYKFIIQLDMLLIIFVLFLQNVDCRLRRQTIEGGRNVTVTFDNDPMANSVDPEFIWSTTTVAMGDTAVLHCSFDAIFSQLRNGNIDWVREYPASRRSGSETMEPIALGKKVVFTEKRYRVFRPHNSALSVLIIRRSKKRDAGVYKCNLSGSSTRQKYMVLNVTESKIEAQTSPAKVKARVGKDVTLWCNATGYPKPMVYWTREDHNRKLPDGKYQYWGNGLTIKRASDTDTGIYACFLDNFVQDVVSYKFTLIVEDRPWNIEAHKMRPGQDDWSDARDSSVRPEVGKTFLLMCDTVGSPRPPPLIRWFFSGKEITKGSRLFFIIDDTPVKQENYISSTLVIMRFDTPLEGEYTCVASNVFRMKKKTIVIQGADSGGGFPWSIGTDDDDSIPNFIHRGDEEGSANGYDDTE